jgi:hypothetical protein
MISSISGFTLTGDLLVKHIFAKCELGTTRPECIGYSEASQNSPKVTNLSYIKQYSNRCGLNGMQLCATVSTYNTEILEPMQSKALQMIVDAPWYLPDTVIQRDLQPPTVKEEICGYSSQYTRSVRLSAHTSDLRIH